MVRSSLPNFTFIGDKPKNRPVSKNNTGRVALRAVLPVTTVATIQSKEKYSAFLVVRLNTSYVIMRLTFGTVPLQMPNEGQDKHQYVFRSAL